ncbi:MAG: cytochrome b/b6 domain-containing protein [Anaerolineales bacterium]|nr:cytochrome b/b6 domain-containing protein [Anaerolineales bacterium]
MSKKRSTLETTDVKATPAKTYVRFSLSQRIEHVVLLVSFTLLGLTGIPQKYATSTLGEGIIRLFGGIENIRQVHHVAAITLAAVSVYHVLAVLYKIIVYRIDISMMPTMEDFRHLIQDVAYYMDLRKHKAYYGRYNYAEKMEYLAVVWGTLLMGITGFMMWNPIVTARLLPGEFIPASKAAHGGEALLAVLAIIIWHFYHVHLRHFNKSMFTGKLTRHEMAEEHPAELAAIESGQATPPPPPETIRRRQRVYFPIAALLAAALLTGAVLFFTAEETAIATVPRGETAQVYAPLTPTPRPTPTPEPAPEPGQGVASDSWAGYYEGLFRNRCGACHGVTAVGGLTLATYRDALKGGNSGPAIVPGDPDASKLVQVQAAGAHPGQLTIDELTQVIAWIKAGALEK